MYYAKNIKKLLDKVIIKLKDVLNLKISYLQDSFGIYLTRIFFLIPKQQLFQISNAFFKMFKITLINYLHKSLDKVSVTSSL